MQIKEDKETLHKIYNEICDKVAFFLKYNLQKIIIGCFYVKNFSVPIMQIWVRLKNQNEYKTFNSYIKGIEIITMDLQDKCEELHDFCNEYGDDWKSFTFIFADNMRFSAKYEYESIKTIDRLFLLDWKGKYFYAE